MKLYRMVMSAVAFVILTAWIDVSGAGFAPVRNFSRQVYGAGSQNWAVSQDAAGRMYFANRDGLLRYDGVRWNLYQLPNYTTVRCVFADDASGRVFVGGSGEFGFFHVSPKLHKTEYVSWTGVLPEKERNFAEIWNVHPIGDGHFAFQGDYKIFLTDGKSVRIVGSASKLTSSAIIGGKLYAGDVNGNVYLLEGGKLRMSAHAGKGSRIVGILPYSKNQMLIVTASDGLFIIENGEIRHAEWEINRFLIENQAFCAGFANGTYAFGTVDNGAVTLDAASGETTFINRQTGLQNNTVLGLGFDFSENLWLCLDNGLSYAMIDSPVYNLLGDASDAGAGYSSMLRGSTLYLATNRGLFSTPYPLAGKETPPKLIKLLGGQVWGIDSIGSDIFVSADDGLYLLGSGTAATPSKIAGINVGSWSVAPLKNHPGKALASTYNGFYLLDQAGGKWTSAGKIEGYDDAGGRFFQDQEGDIWIAHWIKGIFRLTLDSGLRRFSRVDLFDSHKGLPTDRDNTLSLTGGKIAINGASGEFFTPDANGTLQRDTRMSEMLPLKQAAHIIPLPGDNIFVFTPEQVWKISNDPKENVLIDSVSLRSIASSLIPGFEHVSLLDPGNVLVSNQEGFYSISLSDSQHGEWKNGVTIERLEAGDSILFAGTDSSRQPVLKIPFAMNSLSIQVAAPEYRSDNAVLYSYYLEDYDKGWSNPSTSAFKEYTKLHEGSYILRVRATNAFTGGVSETSLRIVILPPWYRSVLAKIIYAILAVLLIFAGYIMFMRLSRKNALKIQRQKEAEMESMRKEAEKEALKKDFEIASLKSSQLELDIKHKSSELSNTAMNVIRKNEILLDISTMLKKLNEQAEEEGKTSPRLSKEMDKIQKLIKENISHDDDWKKFNQNFDIVYADFTRHLSELHPSLTVSEKRLCCYLKMGLSSKEIAPILSISPKSVEMNRYRLRQKMGLAREVNLVEYLQGI